MMDLPPPIQNIRELITRNPGVLWVGAGGLGLLVLYNLVKTRASSATPVQALTVPDLSGGGGYSGGINNIPSPVPIPAPVPHSYQCPTGYHWNSTTEQCELISSPPKGGACEYTHCLPGYRCDPSTGECVTIPCERDDLCPVGYHCVDGYCIVGGRANPVGDISIPIYKQPVSLAQLRPAEAARQQAQEVMRLY